ncbi:MAG TPA: glycosyltransferase, partial [Solirubrobacteraceae bacterium]|nr:glycosyltransferase [Solirubrobacteraceae bacterium]
MQVIKVLFEHPSASLYNPVLTVFTEIARNLDRKRFEVHFAVAHDAEGELNLTEEQARISGWGIGSRASRGGGGASHALWIARVGSSLRGLAHYAREQRIDVIHTDGTPSCGGIGLGLSRLTGIPLLVHFHELVGRYPGGLHEHSPLRRWVERRVTQRGDRLVAVSQFIADQVREHGGTRGPIDVVPNGVDLTRFRPGLDGGQIRREYGIGEDEPLALQLGRVLSSKRHEDFVRALAIARHTVPNLRGLVIGWDDPGQPMGKAQLQLIAEREGLGDAIVFGGSRPDAPELIAAADVVVCPGLEAASGLVALEAMASGKPVIAARSGATPEAVTDGETGLLVPPQAPSEIAEKLVLLASDQRLQKDLGAAGRRHVEDRFDGRALGERFASIYEEVAGRRRKTSPIGRARHAVNEVVWRENWNIGVIHAPVHRLLEEPPPPVAEWLPARRRTYVADPFAVEVDGRTHLFFEQFEYRAKKGVIAHLDLSAGTRSEPEVVLDLPVHASYPFTVRHDGAVYLVPETVQAREVALYGTDTFPRGWRKLATLLEGVAAVDPTLFEHDGRWWLFATLADEGQDLKLFAWHAPELFGPWQPHARNPVKTDIGSARPAGATFVHEGSLYRPAQDCSKAYGGRVVLNRVDELSPTRFSETAVAVAGPDPEGPFPAGLHTICGAGDLTVIDGKRLIGRPPDVFVR